MAEIKISGIFSMSEYSVLTRNAPIQADDTIVN